MNRKELVASQIATAGSTIDKDITKVTIPIQSTNTIFQEQTQERIPIPVPVPVLPIPIPIQRKSQTPDPSSVPTQTRTRTSPTTKKQLLPSNSPSSSSSMACCAQQASSHCLTLMNPTSDVMTMSTMSIDDKPSSSSNNNNDSSRPLTIGIKRSRSNDSSSSSSSSGNSNKKRATTTTVGTHQVNDVNADSHKNTTRHTTRIDQGLELEQDDPTSTCTRNQKSYHQPQYSLQGHHEDQSQYQLQLQSQSPLASLEPLEQEHEHELELELEQQQCQQQDQDSSVQLLSTEQIHSLIDNVNIPSYVNTPQPLLVPLPQSQLQLQLPLPLESQTQSQSIPDVNTLSEKSETVIPILSELDSKTKTRTIPIAASCTIVPTTATMTMATTTTTTTNTLSLNATKENAMIKKVETTYPSRSILNHQNLDVIPEAPTSSSYVTAANTSSTKPVPPTQQQQQQTPSALISASTSTSKTSSSGRWSREEHIAFLEGLKIFGREWKKVAQNIPTRTSAQIRSHAQKYFAKLARDEQHHANMWLSSCNTSSSLDGISASASAAAGGGASVCSSTVGSLSPRRIGFDIGTCSSSVDQHHQHLQQLQLPPSVLERVDKILKDPKGAQLEVGDTLKRLRDHYNELQQKVREKQNAQAANAVATRGSGGSGSGSGYGKSVNIRRPASSLLNQKDMCYPDRQYSNNDHYDGITPMIAVQVPQQQQQQQQPQQQTIIELTTTRATSTAQNTTPIPTTTVHHRFRNDSLASKELIALHVLGRELYRNDNKGDMTSFKTNTSNTNTNTSSGSVSEMNLNRNNNESSDKNSSDEDQSQTTKK